MKLPHSSQRLISVLLSMALLAGFIAPPVSIRAAGSVSLDSLGAAAGEDFDTLAASGTSSVVPNGWDFSESGSNANGMYTAGTGSLNTGDTYSFGSASSSERAFGGLRSGSLVPTLGAQFINNTGATINKLEIDYTGEMWRAGVTNRNAADRLDFQLSTDATSLASGAWTDYNDLDFSSPNISADSGALDGNLPANQAARSYTITGLSIADGDTFWMRWTDFDISSSDDGLSIDDFSLTPLEAGPEVSGVSPADGAANVATNADIVINFSEAVDVAAASFDLNCTTSGHPSFAVSGSGTSEINLNPVDFAQGETCTVTILAAQVSDSDLDDPEDLLAADVVFSFTMDTAPGVASTTPANGASEVLPGANIVIEFTEPVIITPDSFFDVWCDVSGSHAFTVSGGPTSYTLDPADDFYPGDVCTGVVYRGQVEDVDAGDPPENLATDYGFNFTVTTSVDFPPSLSLAVPADGATGVAQDTNIDLTFSEAITVTTSFFDIWCDASLAHTAAVIEDGTTRLILDPDTDFTPGETCTVTLHKEQINDEDSEDPPNNPTEDYILDFGIDPAPAVVSSNPADGAVDVPLTANILLYFNEAVDVSASSFSLVSSSGAHAFTFSGSGTSIITLDPADFSPGEDYTLTVFADQVSDSDTGDPPDAMAADYIASFTAFIPFCLRPATQISAVQGSGLSSPLVGSSATVQGVVVAAYPGLDGFYMQEEAADGDGDSATSEGIFVYTAADPTVTPGNQVRVTGTVGEYGSSPSTLTQLSGPSIEVCGPGETIAPTDIHFPVGATTDFEAYEGMLVRFPQQLFLAEYFNYDRFGEIVLGLPLDGYDRFYSPTSIAEPGVPATTLSNQYPLRRIILDDGSSASSPSSLPHPDGLPFSATNRFRGGDTLTNQAGVIDNSFGVYRLHPVTAGSYTAQNPRPAAPSAVGGTLKVASYNVLNYFLTIDTTSNDSGVCGPSQMMDCRGADSASEFARQRSKLIQALLAIDADIYGLVELENTPSVDPAGDLVNGLNAATAPGSFARIDTGIIGSDAIRVGILYKPGKVTPVGAFQTIDESDDPRFDTSRNRPSLAQTFQVNADGGRFTVVVNHLKSKSSSCGVSDPDTGDGQGNCNLTRKAAAQALVDWLATDPTSSSDTDFLILGDLNSYALEDPIDAIKLGPDDTASTADDYSDLVANLLGPLAYSYVYDGQAGYLDHALASASLGAQVTGITDWHINADEPDIFDYNDTVKDTGEATSERKGFDVTDASHPYRTSDHDPVVIGLALRPSTTTSVVSSGSPSIIGDSVTFTATVTAVAGTPGGTLQFKDGGAALGSPLPLVNGKASLTTSSLALGVHTITAEYSGDSTYVASTGTLTGGQVVNKPGVVIELVSSPNPLILGHTVTFTATLSPATTARRAPAAPRACGITGEVTFKDGSAPLGSAVAVDGNCQAVLVYTGLAPGEHAITAEYSGDVTYAAAISSSLAQFINHLLHLPLVVR